MGGFFGSSSPRHVGRHSTCAMGGIYCISPVHTATHAVLSYNTGVQVTCLAFCAKKLAVGSREHGSRLCTIVSWEGCTKKGVEYRCVGFVVTCDSCAGSCKQYSVPTRWQH